MRFGLRRDGVACVIDAGGGVVPLNGRGAPAVGDLLALIDDFDGLAPALQALADAPDDARPRMQDTAWAAPIPRPRRNLFCVGKNYHDHAAEFAASGFDSAANGAASPAHPIFFTKAPECVIGPGDPIIVPTAVTQSADYEAEFAVVIGRGGRFIPRETAMAHV
ncbi:MAG: fumarylacetoacetate hydrolase family protein, partial [Pseudomonadota bacterium]